MDIQSILEKLWDKSPTIAIFAIGGVVLWKIFVFYYNLKDKLKKVDAHEEEVGDLQKHRIESDKRFVAIDAKLDFLINVVRDIVNNKRESSATVQSFSEKKSPRVLNAAGRSLFEDCGGQAFLDKNLQYLLDKIKDRAPKTALDVELFANHVLLDCSNEDIFNELKVWIYNSPARKIIVNGNETMFDVSIGDICFVLSIPLRDEYLKRNEDILK